MPESFVPLLAPPADLPDQAILFSVRGDHVHVEHDWVGDDHPSMIYLGRLGESDCWAVDLDGDGVPDVPVTPLMGLYSKLPEQLWVIAGRAVQLAAWARDHRFCGRCGQPNEAVPGERAMRCPTCRVMAFPRLAPAIITLVEREDGRALLARNANFPVPMFSCLAGFVEPGETIEQAVVREVKEEVGLTVGKLSYRASQPWPFPHSLMIGFTAQHLDGEIEVDGVEIAEANWYSVDDLPMIPPGMSIARRLIDEWIARN